MSMGSVKLAVKLSVREAYRIVLFECVEELRDLRMFKRVFQFVGIIVQLVHVLSEQDDEFEGLGSELIL